MTESTTTWDGSVPAPLKLSLGTVHPEWIDEYGHVNLAHYVTIADQGSWAFWNWLNSPESAVESRGGNEYVVVEAHTRYLDELLPDSTIEVRTQLLAVDHKRYVLFHEIWKDEALAATNEVKFLAFDLNARRSSAWRAVVSERLQTVLSAHVRLPQPDRAGAGIALGSSRTP